MEYLLFHASSIHSVVHQATIFMRMSERRSTWIISLWWREGKNGRSQGRVGTHNTKRRNATP